MRRGILKILFTAAVGYASSDLSFYGLHGDSFCKENGIDYLVSIVIALIYVALVIKMSIEHIREQKRKE